MPSLALTFVLLLAALIAAPLADPDRVLAFGELDVALGCLSLFFIEIAWTCSFPAGEITTKLALSKAVFFSASFGLLWAPMTRASAFDLVWLGGITAALVILIRLRRYPEPA